MSTEVQTLIVQVSYAGGVPDWTLHFVIVEYVRTGDYRTIQVRKHGWSQTTGGKSSSAALSSLTRLELREDAIDFLLPDDAERTGEAQDWETIRQKLKRYGVDVSVERLREVPVLVEIDADLQEKITRG
ncbi:hypothetical protein [Pseudonocardia sp. ICBG1142]|uniref:hypothetical protein n=1 Tax=Pseudonocardia sp. ICBG1142 TaxID=2846760 RepID=UPI001CF70F88|nr:hypothetical protein [Pseudonocardia sp. ICBG1142]